jgi:hypothetical protein
MAYTAILKRIRLLIPAELDEHYKSICRGFERNRRAGRRELRQ